MSDPNPPGPGIRPITPLKTIAPGPGSPSTSDDKMSCERCGAEMYRMHAVWRCSACGFKTDCCGW